MTIPQAIALGYPGWDALTPRALQRRRDYQRSAYQAAVGCCASTHWAADSIISDYDIEPARVHAVGIGRNRSPESNVRDWSRPRLLFVGRDWEAKNGPAVLRTFARLREVHPGATLDLVGSHPRVDQPGVTGHGFLSLSDPNHGQRLERLYGLATCFVLPSICEAAGIAYLEAATAAIPIIGSAAGGARDLIGDGGCVVDPRNERALLDAMIRFTDPATAARVGALARARSELFTWRAVAERLLRALAIPELANWQLAEFL